MEKKRVGTCMNEGYCLLGGGTYGGPCRSSNLGSCCVHTNAGKCGSQLSEKFGYFFSKNWPETSKGGSYCTHTVKPMPGTCFIRLDLVTLEMEEISGKCVHDRFTVIGGKEPSGNMCGIRSGEVTLVEVDGRKDITVVAEAQSNEWRYNIGITQIPCDEIQKKRKSFEETSYNGKTPCGKKNPSFNKIGAIDKKNFDKETLTKGKKKNEKKIRKSAKEVFGELSALPPVSHMNEFKREMLKRDIYKPMTRNFRLKAETDGKGRILYGNETNMNEYPWQISMWIGKSHFCGGTLIAEEWVVTAAHCVDAQYKNHFARMTVSLGDHNVEIYDEVRNQLRKLKAIVRFPTYDDNYLHGDLALLQLESPVTFSKSVSPACLPVDETDWAYSTALITGWGYTEVTRIIEPRPKTSSVLKEAEVFILPQDLCEKYSPFPLTERMICTYKGPLRVETTCQGDSGGPLVVDPTGKNKYVLVGATSFGVSTCEGPYPSMFARVSTFLDFIHAAMIHSPIHNGL